MITTSSSVNIRLTLKIGASSGYTLDNVSLFITHDQIQKRFNPTSVVNSTTTSTGLITFENVALWGDGNYSFYVTHENYSSLDTTGVNITKLGSGYIKKITNENTVEI